MEATEKELDLYDAIQIGSFSYFKSKTNTQTFWQKEQMYSGQVMPWIKPKNLIKLIKKEKGTIKFL